MARSQVLGLLFVCALVPFHEVAATQPDADDTYGYTHPITFNYFSDEYEATPISDGANSTAE